jgi:hypothetical protein
VAKQATDAGASRVVGVFGQLKASGTTPTLELFGFPDSSSSSAAAGTPGLTLGTTNGAGAASTFVATDATILAFDATAPSTQAFGDAAAVGAAAVAARRDHKHAMPFTAGASTSYSPALTAASVNPTLGAGNSVEGHYFQIGKLVVCWGVIVFGASGVAAGTGEYHVSFPVAPVSSIVRVMGHGQFFDSSASRFYAVGIYALDTSNFRFSIDSASGSTVSAAFPVTWAANDQIQWMMVYESA